eukprot:TRINITY_DN3458_c0_g1_i2.p1 TRINITY_DN3458_c0_g1~~TRINITY_DN3458_c0_g1_i2.p1  ORF type:complete len:396 (-),score=89.29 TRINITY_DN3458_c0_g1_i2:130-1317(-)
MDPPLAPNTTTNNNNTVVSHKRPIEPNSKHSKRPRFAFSFLTDPSIRFAISRFKEVSSRELHRLQSNGHEHETAVNQLVERMVNQTIGDDNSVFTREEMEIVMQISGFSREGALKALKLRSELKRLRLSGMTPIEAIQELANRVRVRGGSSSQPQPNTRPGVRFLERNNEEDDDENREKRKRKHSEKYLQILTEQIEDEDLLDQDSLTRPKRRKDLENLHTLNTDTDNSTDDSQSNIPHTTTTTTTTTTTSENSWAKYFESNDGENNPESDNEESSSSSSGDYDYHYNDNDNDNDSQQSDFVADEDEDDVDDGDNPQTEYAQYTFLNTEEWEEWDYSDDTPDIHSTKHSHPPTTVNNNNPPRVFTIDNRLTNNTNEASSSSHTSREKGRRLHKMF